MSFPKDNWTILNKDHCLFCLENRVLDRAHIVPKSLFHGVELPKIMDERLNYVLLMCPTHHRCYDNGRLNDEEKAIIKPYIDDLLNDVAKLYDTFKQAQAEIPRYLEAQYKSRDKRFQTWFSKLSEN